MRYSRARAHGWVDIGIMTALAVAVSVAGVSADISDDAKRKFNSGVEHESAGHTDSAIAAYEGAVTLAPEYLDAHINVGALYYEKGELPKAAEHLQKAIAIDSTSASAYKNLALVRQKASDHTAAIATFSQYLLREAGDAKGWASLGQSQLELRDSSAALASYEKSLTLDPSDYRTAFNIGNIHQNRGEFHKAIAAYDKAIAKNSKYVPAYFNRAVSSQQLDMAGCVKHYESFIAVAGSSKEWTSKVTQAKDIVKQIKDWLDAQGE